MHTVAKCFGKIRLSKSMSSKIRRLGFRTPTEIQAQAFQPVLEGRNILAASRQGTGKTLAFLLPLLERISKERWLMSEPCIVLEPTRGLAEQTYMLANRLRDPTISVVLLRGGQHDRAGPEMEAQRLLLRRGAHLIVGTPGRVRDALEATQISAENVRTMVIDDAEEMLRRASSRGLQQDVQLILAQLDAAAMPSRQILFFSNTMPSWLRESMHTLCDPVFIDLLQHQPLIPQSMIHFSCNVSGGSTRRARVISWLLEENLTNKSGLDVQLEQVQASYRKENDETTSSAHANNPNATVGSRALIFARSRTEVEFLAVHAMMRRRCAPLHGQMDQRDRTDALATFKASDGFALVTTDHAAKGLELPGVPLIIHTTVPESFEAYAKRVGQAIHRNTDSQHQPISIAIHDAHNEMQLRDLERQLGQRFQPLTPPSDEALRNGAMAYVARELREATSQYDSASFDTDAAKLLDVHGTRLMAAALVLLERRKRAEEWLSPLSGRPRYTPLLFFDPFLENLRSREAVVKAITSAIKRRQTDTTLREEETSTNPPRHARTAIGRVELTSKGYVADVPREHVSHILGDPLLHKRGITVMMVHQTPGILEEAASPSSNRSVSKSRLRRRHHRPTLSERRSKRRAQFMFPGGRRSPLGSWLRPGTQERDTSEAGV